MKDNQIVIEADDSTSAAVVIHTIKVNNCVCEEVAGSSYQTELEPISSAEGGNADTPSSQYEAVIRTQLQEILHACEERWSHTLVWWRVALRGFLFEQSAAVLVTSFMLFISCGLYPVSQTVFCTAFFVLLYACCAVLQSYLFWTRITETKYRTASVMREVIQRWSLRISEMASRPSQTAEERRLVFLESLAQLPAKAFRMVAVVDDRTYRLKHIMKSLMVKRCKRLDEATLRVRRYLEPVMSCKLVDVMQITLESDSIVLKPMTDKTKPPRLPNLLISHKRFLEEEATTDESDGERESRTALGGGNSISVSQHMEYFVNRVFLLVWMVGMVLTIGTGVLYYCIADAPLGESLFLDPSVALLGLLPVNAIVLNRFLVLYANVYLDKLFHYIVAKRTHSFEDRLPRFPLLSTFIIAVRVLLRLQPNNGGRNPLVLSTSLVDGFGMATVIAMLDKTGIVTDMVLLPVRVLLLRASVARKPESSSSDDDDGAVVLSLADANAKEARERQREMQKQIKRKKFQESRFTELRLDPCPRDSLAVDFADNKLLRKHQSHLNPLCLCVLLHATARQPFNLQTWTEPFRFCDRSPRWIPALHWIPRACGFKDGAGSGYLVLARIFQIDTKVQSGYRNSFPEQTCSLLVESSDGSLHLFTIGTPFMVSRFCSVNWTGSSIEELDASEKAEVTFMGKHQWEEGMCLETVAFSHRVLPERYRCYVEQLPRSSTRYSEFFFRNGVEVNSVTEQEKQERRERNRAGASAEVAVAAAAAAGHGAKGVPFPPNNTFAVAPRSPLTVLDEQQPDLNGDDVLLVEEDSVMSTRGRKQRVLLPYVPRRCSSAPVSLRYHERGFIGVTVNKYNSDVNSQREMTAKGLTLRRRVSSDDMPSETLGGGGELAEDDCVTTRTFIKLMATTGHTFLGLVGVRDSVRPNVQTAMSMLDEAGVRCMYFCPDNERQTKSFGSCVGLETDWNCCISLKEDAVALDPHSIRAQLPFGIKSIRKHILHVDPIPLQVNLFSHAQGVSTRAMMSILQDNHEIVVAVGSVFNHGNVRSFVQADLSVGVLPTRRGLNADKESELGHGRIVEPSDFAASNSLNRDIPLYRNVAELIGCSCSLRAPPTTSILPVVATMVRQARLRLSGIGNCVEFVMHANLLLVMLNTISVIAGAPLLVNPTMTVFQLNVIIPILALACTYTAYSGLDPMKTMPSRHNFFVRLAIFRHSSIVWCVRYMPSLVVLLALGITAAEKSCGVGCLELLKHSSDKCMYAAQGYVALTFNYWLMIHSWTHMSRHHPISWTLSLRLGHGRRSTYLFHSFRWFSASLIVTVLSVLLVMIETPVSVLGTAFFPSIPHFVIALVFPVVLMLLDWPIKRWREKRFSNMQKFRKLTFGTRLGMHSPRGDYEPEGFTYATSQPEGASAGGGDGTGEGTSKVHATLWKRIRETFYRYSTMRGGKLELNCVCCDHIGGNYASYHVSAAV